MDIVTNVIGALFFVVIFAALSAFGVKGRIVTPVLAQADTEGVIFECRSNTVLFPDLRGLAAHAEQVWQAAENKGVTDPHERVKRVREANIHNAFYRLEPGSEGTSGELAAALVPIADATGENSLELQLEHSAFLRRLAKLDPKRHHVFLLVDAKSFDVFHAVRRCAIAKGFAVGWDPMEPGATLRFGQGGVVDIATHF